MNNEILDVQINWLCNQLRFKYNVTKSEVMSNSRFRNIVDVRHIIFKLLYEHNLFSLDEIGAKFNRSHCTVLFARKKIADMASTDRYFREYYRTIEKNFIQWKDEGCIVIDANSVSGKIFFHDDFSPVFCTRVLLGL